MVRFFLLLALFSCSCLAKPLRVVSLSPHLTELTYALKRGDWLVGASDFSDYPAAAKKLPRVASYQGVDFEAIMRLKPDLILAWRGGNKPQDLARLQQLGFKLYFSHPQSPMAIADDIIDLGSALQRPRLAKQLAMNLRVKLNDLRRRYATTSPVKVLYYMWPKPLMTIGPNAWASQLLSYCHATNIFANAPTDYPEVSVEAVIQRHPQLIIAAQHKRYRDVQAFWQSWQRLLGHIPIKVVDPDRLHRFTPRLLDGLTDLCQAIHAPSSTRDEESP